MFTGIIEEIGTILKISHKEQNLRIKVSAPKSCKELQIKDSVAINGVCQTVISRDKQSFEIEAVEETLNKTNFSKLKPNDKVNIELPLKLQSRLGGHIVLGHVDCVGTIKNIKEKNGSWIFTITYPKEFSKYLISVGSIAIDGVSLTIARLKTDVFDVSIIPYTMENTIFNYYKIGNIVNLEFDVIGKYVSQLINDSHNNANHLSEIKLRNLGF